jgi:hypothetical protein
MKKVTITARKTEYTSPNNKCTLGFNKSYTWTDLEIEQAMAKKKWSGVEGMLKTETIQMAFADGLHLYGSEPVYQIEEI